MRAEIRQKIQAALAGKQTPPRPAVPVRDTRAIAQEVLTAEKLWEVGEIAERSANGSLGRRANPRSSRARARRSCPTAIRG